MSSNGFDLRGLQRIADCAFEEIALNEAHSYRRFVAQFDRVIEEEWAARAEKRGAARGKNGMAALRFRIAAFPFAVLKFVLPLAVRVVPRPVRRAIKSFLTRIQAIIAG